MSRSDVQHFLKDHMNKMHILVLGDVMLDRYVYGDVSRISPEAPVPINRVSRRNSTLGGAANVTANLASLGATVSLIGIIGEDYHGTVLQRLLENLGVTSQYLLRDKERETITKVRILDNRQQMMRLDYEQFTETTSLQEETIIEYVKELLKKGVDGIVLSDYGKGFFTHSVTKRIIALGREHNVLVMVDPKGIHWEKYKGANYITPNIKELSTFLHHKVDNTDQNIVEAAKEVLTCIDLENIVVTRSEKGLTLVNEIGIWHAPAIEKSVYDVSGAGDTVIAMLTLAFAEGLSNREAMWLANTAASIVVSHVGTYPVHKGEVFDEWYAYLHMPNRSTHVFKGLSVLPLISQWREEGDSIVFTNGCFDLLHRGHIEYLKDASLLGTRLVVAVNSDRSVKQLKGLQRPIISEADRAFALSNLSFIDAVIIFDEDTPLELIKAIKPEYLVKGGDYKKEDVVGREWAQEVHIIPFVEGYSTTSLIQKIKDTQS